MQTLQGKIKILKAINSKEDRKRKSINHRKGRSKRKKNLYCKKRSNISVINANRVMFAI